MSEPSLPNGCSRVRRDRNDKSLMAITATAGVVNLAATVIAPHSADVAGWFAVGWIGFAPAVLAWQIVTRRSSWSMVVIILGAACAGFVINGVRLSERV